MSDEIKEGIKAKVLQFLSMKKLETNKLEFKREWHKLKEPKGYNEFLKDTTGIINCYGGDDAFIVFGVCEDEFKLFESKLSDSGYSDSADIKNIIDKNIDKPFRFDIDYLVVDGVTLCVIHLLPSTDKPHVVLRYMKDGVGTIFENAIFIRSGSAKVSASKADLDRMYIERNNIIVERKAEVSINFHAFKSSSITDIKSQAKLWFDRKVSIENLGTRVLSVSKIVLQFDLGDGRLLFLHKPKSEKAIVINSGDIFSSELRFECIQEKQDVQTANRINDLVNEVLKNPKHGSIACFLLLVSGETLPTNLFMPNIDYDKPDLDLLAMLQGTAFGIS